MGGMHGAKQKARIWTVWAQDLQHNRAFLGAHELQMRCNDAMGGRLEGGGSFIKNIIFLLSILQCPSDLILKFTLDMYKLDQVWFMCKMEL